MLQLVEAKNITISINISGWFIVHGIARVECRASWCGGISRRQHSQNTETGSGLQFYFIFILYATAPRNFSNIDKFYDRVKICRDLYGRCVFCFVSR